MKKILSIISICFLTAACNSSNKSSSTPFPAKYLGKFTDDYSIRYVVTEKLFLQEPDVRYHILSWNAKDKYIIAKNDANNPSEQNLFTRIDYMDFEKMEPFTWGFCFTVYKAENAKAAEAAAAADRSMPMKGCGGFPFSRMKRIE